MKKYYKYLTIIPLCSILLVYTQCMPTAGKNKSKLKYSDSSSSSNSFDSDSFGYAYEDDVNDDNTSSGNSGGSSAVIVSSVEAFSKTTHLITKNRCNSCHASLQQPLHAASNAKTAHDAIITAAKVNLDNPAQSRLVLKLRENHNCWGNCQANADQMQDSIEEWKEMMEVAVEEEETDTTTTSDGLVTNESATVSELLDPNQVANSGNILVNFEAAMLRAPMARATAGDISYVWVPSGTHNATLNTSSNNAGIATIQVSIPQSGQYKVFGYVSGPTSNDDSFYVKYGNNNYFTLNLSTRDDFYWKEIGTTTFGSGNQMIEVREREDGAKISKMFITDNLDQSSENIPDGTVATIVYPLDTILPTFGATFQIDISEYDDYSYKISRPRIYVNSGSIKIKGVKPRINGSWNPQHSTYTIIDRTVNSSGMNLSNSSMIILKDRGNLIDKLSFEFDELEFIP